MTNPESSPQSGSLPSYEAGSEFETLPAEASTGIVTQETDEDITNARVLLNGPEGHQKELPASRSRKRPAPGDIEIATKWMRWKESELIVLFLRRLYSEHCRHFQGARRFR